MMKSAFAFVISFLSIAMLCQTNHVMAAVPAPENTLGATNCAPRPGEGAQWLSACEAAAQAGDGRAAWIVGNIYWNGDGVTKDNVNAARWWKIADQLGQPEAAFTLGGEAFVRAFPAHHQFDVQAIDEAIVWYQKAAKIDPLPAKRQQAQIYIDRLLKFKRLMPHA